MRPRGPPGKLKTKRWNDPAEPDDGTRILITRYRPRALPKGDETWTEWHRELSPSEELHADFYGKNGAPITFELYVERFREEMRSQRDAIQTLGDRLKKGETLTLLCSNACVDPARCHRTLIAAMVREEMQEPG